MSTFALQVGTALVSMFLLSSLTFAGNGPEWIEGWSRSLSPSGNWRALGASADGSTLAAFSMEDDLIVSPDFGETWRPTKFPAAGALVTEIAISGDGTAFLVGTSQNGAWHSQNGGKDWAVSLGGEVSKVRSASAAGRFYVLSSEGLMTGNGLPGHWERITSPHEIRDLSVSADGRVILILGPDWDGNALSMSEDGGSAWRRLEVGNQAHKEAIGISGDGRTIIVTVEDPAVSNHSFAAILSRDGGKTWEKSPLPIFARPDSVAASEDGSRILIANVRFGDENPVLSGDGGENWVRIETVIGKSIAMSGDGLRIAAAASDADEPVFTFGRMYRPSLAGTNISGDLELTGTREIELSVEAGGGYLRYQWRRDGVNLQPTLDQQGVNSRTLLLTEVTLKQFGTYSVLITNELGSMEAAVGEIRPIIVPPAITNVQQSGGQVLIDGSPVEFSAAVSGNLLGYLWFRDGRRIEDGPGIQGARTAKLVIRSPTGRDAGEYSLVATNPAGRAEAVAGRLDFSVPEFRSARAIDGPVLLTGESFGFSCVAAGGDMHYTLFRNGELLPAKSHVAEEALHQFDLPPFAPEMSGDYWVVASNHLGMATSQVFQVRLALWPLVNTQDWSSVSISADGRYRSACSVSNLLVSADSGRTWIDVSSSAGPMTSAAWSQDATTFVISVDPDDPSLLPPTNHIWNVPVVHRWVASVEGHSDVRGRTTPPGELAMSADGKVILSAESYWRSLGFPFNWTLLKSQLVVSHDQGATWWLPPELPGLPWAIFDSWSGLAISGDGSTAAAIYTDHPNSALFVSRDRGVTWEYSVTPPVDDSSAAAINHDGTLMVLAAKTGVFVSNDKGRSWEAT